MALESSMRRQRYHRYFVDLSRFYQKKQTRVYTGLVLTLLTTIFFLVFAIRPTLITIASLVKEIKDQRVIAEKLDKKIDDLNLAKKEYQQIEKKLYLVDQALPLDSNLTTLVKELEALAKKEGVSILSLQFEKINLKGGQMVVTGQPENVPAVNFSMSVSGAYPQLNSFLDSLTQLRRVTLVDDFTIQSKKEKALSLTIKAGANFLPSLTKKDNNQAESLDSQNNGKI